jgi:hypothetical protein
VVTAAIGSVVLVAVFFLLLPPRHSAAAASEGVQMARLVDEKASLGAASGADRTLCPAPAALTANRADGPVMSEPGAVTAAAKTSPEPEQQTLPELPKSQVVEQDLLVNFAAVAPPRTPGCQQCGTAVDFYDNPATATKNAVKEDKLLFVIQVAGNFEEPGFT